MNRRAHVGCWLAMAALVLAAPGVSWSQEEQEPEEPGVIERAGRQLDRFLEDVQSRFQDLSDEVQKRFAQARSRVEELNVEARVYARLRWDKALAEADLAVEADEGGVLTLHGTVPSAEAKAKAVALAGDTVGVDRVVDELEVAPGEPAGADETSPD